MKKTVFLSLLLIGLGSLRAQIIDSVTPVNLRGFMENLFSAIDQSSITSGILMEKGIVNIDFGNFSGSASMEDTSSQGIFYSVYNQLYYSHLDTTQTGMISPDSLANLYRWHNAEKTTAISLALFGYNYFTSVVDANDEYYFTEVNDVLYDNPNSTGSPYGQSTVFIAGPHESTTKSRFIIPSGLFFSNTTTTGQVSLQIDFADGNGWQSVAFDQEYPIAYSEIGEKTLKVKLTANGTTHYCAFSVEVKKSATATENIYYDDMWDDPLTASEAYILWGTGNGSKIMRPVIFVEGFDYQDEYDEDDLFEIMNGDYLYGAYDSRGLVRRLQGNGYDVIILNFLRRGGKSIYDNSEVLHRLITWVNAEKAANGSSYQNVVGGASMGGVIARYTLARMEQELCEDHQTRLYISYDAPHQGAYIPLSMQYMLHFTDKLSIGLVSDIHARMNEIKSPAAQQLFVSHILNDGQPLNAHTSFYQTLNDLGYPQKTRNIAVSLGNSTTALPTNTTNSTYNAGDMIMRIDPNGYCKWCTQITARNYALKTTGVGTVATLKAVFYTPKWFGLVSGRKAHELTNSSFSYVSPVERDNVSGGYLQTQAEVAGAVNSTLSRSVASIPNNRFWHDIIATPSAIDYISPQTVTTLNSESKYQLLSSHKVPFDDILFANIGGTHFHAGAIPQSVNDFFFDEITQSINVNPIHIQYIKSPLNYDTYNYGNPNINMLQSVSIGSSGVLSINATGSTSYLNGPSSSQSHFDVTTMPCSEVIIGNGGNLNVGESSSKTGSLFISGESKLIIKDGGKLTLYDGSSVIIEDGSQFVFEDGAQIELAGYGSVVTIQGKLAVGNNANFTFSGYGKLVFDQNVKWGTNAQGNAYLKVNDYWDIGSNASFTVHGSTPVNYDRHLILAEKPVYMKMEDGTSFSSVDIRYGRIALKNGALIGSFSPTQLFQVKVNGYYPESNHKGFWIWNAGGTNLITFCKFEGGDKGLRLDWLGGGNPAIINSCDFTDNGRGIEILRGPISVTNCDFDKNNTAIYSKYATGLSLMNGCDISKGQKSGNGLSISTPQQGATFTVANSKFTGLLNAINFQNSTLRSTCTEYGGCSNGISYDEGILDISDGAKNTFHSNDNDIELYCFSPNTGILLDNGENDFEARGRNDAFYITGYIDLGVTLNSSPIQANMNNLPTYVALNGPTIMPTDLRDIYGNLVPLHVPNPATSTNCNGGSSSGSGYVTAYSIISDYTAEGGVINTSEYSGTLKAAALDALQYVSSGQNILNDELALTKINSILQTTISNTDGYTSKIQSFLYANMHVALNQAYQYGSMHNTENGEPSVNDTVEDVIDIIDDYLSVYNINDSTTYDSKFRFTLDKVHAYRVSGYYDLAMNLLNNTSSWTFNNDHSMRAGYWQCVCEAERAFFEDEMSAEDFDQVIENCKQQYVGYTSKSSSANPRIKNVVESNHKMVLSSYPQPTSGRLTVVLSEPVLCLLSYQVSDVSGKILLKNSMLPDNQEMKLDVSRLPVGVYFLSISFNSGTEVVKFSKE